MRTPTFAPPACGCPSAGWADAALRAAVIKLLNDKNWNVRRQVAASIGEMPAADRIAPATALLTRDGDDPIIVDAAISSLKGIEAEVLTGSCRRRLSRPRRRASPWRC